MRGGRKKYYQNKNTQNFDTSSCNTQNQQENRLIETGGNPNRGWNHNYYNDTISLQGEINNEPRLIERDYECKVSYNEWEYTDDYLDSSFKNNRYNNPKNGYKKHKNVPYRDRKIQKFDTTASQKTDKSNTSLASEKTKNSRSDAFEKNIVRQESSNVAPKKFINDWGHKDPTSEPYNKTSIKRSNRTFIPKEKVPDNILKSASFQLEFVLENQEIMKTVTYDLLSEEPSDGKHLIFFDTNGQKMIIGIDLANLSNTLNTEINPEINLRHALKLYITESLIYHLQI
jgi:hypothetical protein